VWNRVNGQVIWLVMVSFSCRSGFFLLLFLAFRVGSLVCHSSAILVMGRSLRNQLPEQSLKILFYSGCVRGG